MTTALAPAAPAPTAAVPAMVPSFLEGFVTASQLGESGAPMVDVALALVNAGWPVFPCGQNKAPLIRGGFKARSVDPEQINQWWVTHPDALPAIVPGDGDLAALDVDSTGAAAAVDGAGHLDETGGFVVLTGGTSAPFSYRDRLWPPMHLYVRANEQPKLPGVVVRFRSGYVIAPGARRGERVYRVASSHEPRAWTGDANTTPVVQATATTRPSEQAPDIEGVRQAVACIPNDKAGRAPFVGMAHMIRGAVGEAGREIFLEWAARWTGGPVDLVENERVWDTLPPSRLGWDELWRYAATFGFDAGPERIAEAQDDFDDEITHAAAPPPHPAPLPRAPLRVRLEAVRAKLAGIPDALDREIARAEEIAALAKESGVRADKLSQLLAAFDAPHRVLRATIIRPGPTLRDAIAAAPSDALVPGYLYTQAQHVLFGVPAAFKTFLALDWALHIASGLPWLNRIPVRQRGVVFFAGEAASRHRIRVAAWCAARSVSVEQAACLPFALVDTVPTLGTGDDGLQNALALIKDATADPALLIFDNMTRMAAQSGLSTVDPNEFGRILAALDTLGRTTGASTLTICHSPLSDPNKVAGSYPIMANPDVVLQSVRGAGLTTKLRSIKARDTADAEALHLTLEEQDVLSWLTTSYTAAGLPVPERLTGTDFDHVPGSNANTGVPPQFTSLVVASGIRAAEAAAAAGIAKRDVDRDVVLGVIVERPGLSKAAIRDMVTLAHKRTDELLVDLERDGAVVVERGRQGHTYYPASGAGAVETGAAA